MTSPTKTHHRNNSHQPVLLEAVRTVLAAQPGETYLDLTAGYGGHASAIRSDVGASNLLTLVDRDPEAIKALQPFKKDGAQVIHSDYFTAARKLKTEGRQFDMVLMDIGVSSPHLDRPERGFSFQTDGPLDMRMNQTSGHTAAELIHASTETELADMLYTYGEERRSRKLARAIKQAQPATTGELARLVETTIGRHGKNHPATRTFQALRIAVNGELDQLTRTLPLLPQLLTPSGRVAIISFHSLEDRLIKQFFKQETEGGYEATLQLLTKKPIPGTDDVFNRRARSAKLRAAIKINNERS